MYIINKFQIKQTTNLLTNNYINIKFINIDVKTIYHRKNGRMASNRRPVKYDFIKILNVDLKNNKVWFNQ